MNFNINDVVAKYIELRNDKARIKAEAEVQTNAITERMLKLEAWLKQQADQLGTTQFKTPSGTAFFKTDDFANVAEWDAALAFILSNKSYDMLEKRVNKTAIRSYLNEHKQLPPGINYGTRLVLGVRKPTAKTEEILSAAEVSSGEDDA